MVSVKKETVERLHKHCQRGEKHDNLVRRLIDICESERKEVNLSDGTVRRLLEFTGGDNVDEALNMLMEKFRIIKEK